MTLYVAVSQCSRCKKPALGYIRKAKTLSQAEIKKEPFVVNCLCGSPAKTMLGSEVLKVFEMPWEL